jgi:hypothetical protein
MDAEYPQLGEIMLNQKTTLQKLNVTIHTDQDILSSELYTIIVDVTNLNDTVIDDVSVESKIIPGKFITQRAPENVEFSELETKRVQLVKEMEDQIEEAYQRKAWEEMNLQQKISTIIRKNFVPTFVAPVAFGLKLEWTPDIPGSVPSWARQSLKIEEWSDIERVENEIMSYEKEDSFLRKAFLLNKQKLRELIDKLEKLKETEMDRKQKLKNSYSIQPNDTLSFPFQARAPLVYRKRNFFSQFTISYNDKQSNTQGTFSSTQQITFNASPLVITAGVMTGAISGYLVKTTLMSPVKGFTMELVLGLLGTIVLGLVMAAATVKTPDIQKSVTAENFVGGFIIGALTGMFSDTIIDKLKTLING